MTRDILDDLLDASAPATQATDPREVQRMVRRARRAARPQGLSRIAIAVGIVVAIVGGAGVAVASDGFVWAPWIQQPVGAVPFTMSDGYSCELRYTPWRPGLSTDRDFLREVNDDLEAWYRSTDVAAAARRALPTSFAGESLTEVQLEPGETLESLSPGEAEHRLFDQEWMAWDLAIADLESQELARHGIDSSDARFGAAERAGQIQCFDLNGDLYRPGSGE